MDGFTTTGQRHEGATGDQASVFSLPGRISRHRRLWMWLRPWPFDWEATASWASPATPIL